MYCLLQFTGVISDPLPFALAKITVREFRGRQEITTLWNLPISSWVFDSMNNKMDPVNTKAAIFFKDKKKKKKTEKRPSEKISLYSYL